MAEGGVQLSNTADFLKASLAKSSDQATAKSMLAGQPTFSSSRRQLRIKRDLTPSETMSNPRAVATRNALAPVNGVQLRPFVVGRKLPSKAELESQFATMSPQFDSGNDGSNLSAAVSENNYMTPQVGQDYPSPAYGDYRPADPRMANRARLKEAARVASGYDRRATPRSVPNQRPVTPGQVGFPCAQQAVADMHPVRNGHGSLSEWGQLAADIKSGHLDPAMQAEAAKLAASGAQGMGERPAGSAGPAPFPLNLLPEASLKQFIGSTKAAGARPQPGAPSYFGSWKQGNQIASAKPALHPSTFHSNLTGFHGNAQAHNISSSAFSSYAPMAMSHHRALPHQSGEYPAAKHIAQNVHASTSVNVATYGPYVSHVTF